MNMHAKPKGFSKPGTMALVISRLPEIEDKRAQESREQIVRSFFARTTKDRLSVNDIHALLAAVKQYVEKTQQRGFDASAREAAQTIATAFADAIDIMARTPAIVEPRSEERLDPAKPNMPRHLTQAPVAAKKYQLSDIERLILSSFPARPVDEYDRLSNWTRNKLNPFKASGIISDKELATLTTQLSDDLEHLRGTDATQARTVGTRAIAGFRKAQEKLGELQPVTERHEPARRIHQFVAKPATAQTPSRQPRFFNNGQAAEKKAPSSPIRVVSTPQTHSTLPKTKDDLFYSAAIVGLKNNPANPRYKELWNDLTATADTLPKDARREVRVELEGRTITMGWRQRGKTTAWSIKASELPTLKEMYVARKEARHAERVANNKPTTVVRDVNLLARHAVGAELGLTYETPALKESWAEITRQADALAADGQDARVTFQTDSGDVTLVTQRHSRQNWGMERDCVPAFGESMQRYSHIQQITKHAARDEIAYFKAFNDQWHKLDSFAREHGIEGGAAALTSAPSMRAALAAPAEKLRAALHQHEALPQAQFRLLSSQFLDSHSLARGEQVTIFNQRSA